MLIKNWANKALDKNKYNKTLNHTDVSNTSRDLADNNVVDAFVVTEACSDSRSAVGTFVQTNGLHWSNGELCADTELSDRIESLELDARCRIDSSEELDFRLSSFSLSSSLQK